MTKQLKLVDVIETPDHFYYGGIDIPHATSEKAKVEKLDDGMVLVTKSFIVNSYTYQKKHEPFFGILIKKVIIYVLLLYELACMPTLFY